MCIQQTVIDLLSRGYEVHVVADGCSSRSQTDRIFALEVNRVFEYMNSHVLQILIICSDRKKKFYDWITNDYS